MRGAYCVYCIVDWAVRCGLTGVPASLAGLSALRLLSLHHNRLTRLTVELPSPALHLTLHHNRWRTLFPSAEFLFQC